MKNRYYLILLVVFGVVVGCDNLRVIDENVDFVNETWHKDSVLTFSVNIDDTITPYNIYINNRITQQYKYSNMYLFIDTKLPNNQLIHDTLECILVNDKGKFLGSGFGSVWSNKIRYRMNVRFPYRGDYIFTIEQAMRDDELKHVLSTGIRVEKQKK
jgi:gliding motility-associated lipoprotein GldH